jgi:hypothetical protein
MGDGDAKTATRRKVWPSGPVPSEDSEQIHLVAWLELMKKTHPDVLYHSVPNGGWRHMATAARLKATGAMPGVPDLFFPVARQGFHGLYVELKRTRGGRLSENQKRWMEALTANGYRAEVCEGAEEAKRTIMAYLGWH